MARDEEKSQKQRNEKKNKNGLLVNRSLTTLEVCEVFTLLFQRMQSSKKLSRTRGENWKFRCQQQCLARPKEENTGKPVALLVFARQNTHASLKQPNLRKSVWKELCKRNHEDHIAGKGFNSLNHQYLAHKFNPMPQAMKIPDAKAAVDKEWEKLEKIQAWQLTKVRNKKK